MMNTARKEIEMLHKKAMENGYMMFGGYNENIFEPVNHSAICEASLFDWKHVILDCYHRSMVGVIFFKFNEDASWESRCAWLDAMKSINTI